MFGHFPQEILDAFYEAYSEKANMACNKPKMEHHGGKKQWSKHALAGKRNLFVSVTLI